MEWRRIDDPDFPAPMDETENLLAANAGWHGYMIMSGFWHKERKTWWHGSSGIHADVTHWMPLPEPPKL